MDQSDFKKSIPVSHQTGKDLCQWIASLPQPEQQEWARVSTIHEQVVASAIKNDDARNVFDENGNVNQILWKNDDVHCQYIKLMTDHETYLSFWKRFRDLQNVTHT